MIDPAHLPGVIRAGAFLLLLALPAGAETVPVPSSDPLPGLSALGHTLDSAGQYSLNALSVRFADDSTSVEIESDGPSWWGATNQQYGCGLCYDGNPYGEGPGMTGGQVTR